MGSAPADTIRADCFVVGAGPVGMTAALALARRGCSVVIIDKYRRAALHSYALALHPESLRLLDRMGVAEKLVELGQPVRTISVHAGSSEAAEIDVTRIPGPFSFALVLPQTALEGALEAALGEADVLVRWDHQLLSFELSRDVVNAVVAEVDPGGAARSRRVESRYLIGADGGTSLTARLLGVGRREFGPPIDYVLVEFEGEVRESDRVHLVVGERTADVFWPLGPERGRWSFELAGGPEEVAGQDLRSLLDARAPWFGPIERIEWTTTVRFQPFLAESFGWKRAWLAGDAGHFNSPVGVQSMNIGIREACDLARRIATATRGRSSAMLLRIYKEDRQREWKALLGVHSRIRVGSGAPSWVRDAAARIVTSLPASGRDLNVLLRQVGLRVEWSRRRR